MCTVTIVPLGRPAPWPPGAAGFRLACNRDEARTRPRALPPRPLRYGGRTALVPTDGEEGGTWIAVSDAGLVMALLNRNAAGRAGDPGGTPGRPPSRGRVIPALLPSANLDEAIGLAEDLPLVRLAPFRLVLTDGREVGDLIWDGTRLAHHRGPWSGDPLLFTSSSLGDQVVVLPRRTLFRTLVAARGAADLAAGQDLFHRHSWPDRPHLSVCMRRDDACTVSHSVIEVGPGEEARFLYYPDAPDSGVAPAIGTLVLRRGGGAAT